MLDAAGSLVAEVELIPQHERPLPRAMIIAASTVVVVAGLHAASGALELLLLAALLAALSYPLVGALERARVPTVVAVLLALVVDLAALTGLGVLLAMGIKELAALPERYDAPLERLLTDLGPLLRRLGVDLQQVRLIDLFGGAHAIEMAEGAVGRIAEVLSNAIVVLLTMAFMLLEATGFSEKLRLAFGRSASDMTALSRINGEIQKYIRIKTGVSALTGVVLGSWVAVLHVDFALLWGLLFFAGNFIPNIGTLATLIPPLLLALIQHGVGTAILVAAGSVGVHTLLGNVIEPQLMGRRLGLSPLVVVISLIVWGWVWGVTGMLLSVPLTMILKIALENSRDYRWFAALLDPSPHPRRGRGSGPERRGRDAQPQEGAAVVPRELEPTSGLTGDPLSHG
jgi:predicted PurR-regulated permease PerM